MDNKRSDQPVFILSTLQWNMAILYIEASFCWMSTCFTMCMDTRYPLISQDMDKRLLKDLPLFEILGEHDLPLVQQSNASIRKDCCSSWTMYMDSFPFPGHRTLLPPSGLSISWICNNFTRQKKHVLWAGIHIPLLRIINSSYSSFCWFSAWD